MRTRFVDVWLATFVGLLIAVATAAAVDGSGGRASESDLAIAARQPMDLVYISDSSGWAVARFYARRIRKDLVVEVRVHDEWQSDLAASTILKRLRTSSDPWIPLIRNAEVIVVYGNPNGSETAGHPWTGGDCMGDGKPPIADGPETYTTYIAHLKAIYRQIFKIRKNRPVIFRTANWAAPIIGHGPGPPFPGKSWAESGITEACTASWEIFSWAISRAANAYRVPVADVYTAFNGKDHLEDPVEKGYMQADNIHPSNAGRAVIAETLADLGYRQVKPPR